MRSSIDEIIAVDNPQEAFYCTVWKYQASLSEMLLRVYDERKEQGEADFNLVFQGVLYFEGPFRWPGVAFYNGSDEECIGLLDQIGLENAEQMVNTGFYQLFKLHLANTEIKIVATKVIRDDNWR